MHNNIKILTPNWNAPKNVIAFSTYRHGGFSQDEFESLNLGSNSGDDYDTVQKNRAHLIETLNLPSTPAWLNQTHGTNVVSINADYQTQDADASFSNVSNLVCCVLTADCLPILICNQQGDKVAAIHAGWRSLVTGVIENTLAALECEAADLIAWYGPCICKNVYEVGNEVRDQFLHFDSKAKTAFEVSPNQRWLLDLKAVASQRLESKGVTNIFDSGTCTYCDTDFYSYRRENPTGRIGSFIYFS